MKLNPFYFARNFFWAILSVFLICHTFFLLSFHALGVLGGLLLLLGFVCLFLFSFGWTFMSCGI